jgi:hypothetical protein
MVKQYSILARLRVVRSFAYGIAGASNTKSTRGWNTFEPTTCRDLPVATAVARGGSRAHHGYKFENTIKSCIFNFEKKKEDFAETTIVPACPNFTTGAHAILAHQDILGGWRVGLTNSSPVLNFEEERGRAPD